MTRPEVKTIPGDPNRVVWHCALCGAEVEVVPQGEDLALPPGWVCGTPGLDEFQAVYCSATCRVRAEGHTT